MDMKVVAGLQFLQKKGPLKTFSRRFNQKILGEHVRDMNHQTIMQNKCDPFRNVFDYIATMSEKILSENRSHAP